MAMDDIKKFSELIFVLTLGTGAGISVERKYVNKLPKVNSKIDIIHKNYVPVAKRQRKEHTELIEKSRDVLEIVIGDSKFGWAKAVDMYFEIITSKQYADVDFVLLNYDNVRPAGERLKTFGGFASGHTALSMMFEKINNLIKAKVEKQSEVIWQSLKPVDCLDICTIIAENVVSGGTRRSAEIMFCDPDEKDVLDAKSNIYYQNDSGAWVTNKAIEHRTLSNNTVLYQKRPSKEELHNHFQKMILSGEPAIGNFEEMLRRRADVQGGNPCFEILLRDRGVCNLTEVNVKAFVSEDGVFDLAGLLRAQELSARMGYRMATIELELHEWNLTNIEDRLTGCSLTGVMDALNMLNYSKEETAKLLRDLRDAAVNSANDLADKLKMNRPKLVTAIKPSGTISQLPTVSSGMHYSHSPYFIRRVRVGINDPIVPAMKEMGFECIEESMSKVVFEFPVQAPEGKTKYDVGAVEQLEMYKMFMDNYVQHNASNTIHVREHEWQDVEDWVYENWDSMVGVTFLSLDDSFYPLMPYEAITKEQYLEMKAKTPKFNPAVLTKYENFDEDEEVELDADCDSGACPVR